MINTLKRFRNFYLKNIKWKEYQIGKNFHSGRGVQIWGKTKIVIGDNFYIGRYSQIECNTTIGDNVIIGNFAALVGKYDHNYKQIGVPIRLSSQIRSCDYNWLGVDSEVVIEDDVWLGYGVIVISGVRICKGSIVAAGSIVTKDIEPYSIYGGNPARFIKKRFTINEQEEHELKLKST
tara:strand:- start:5826 stop:6359 length:534 start_codon:yes stop_codon:yes gene_type:complete